MKLNERELANTVKLVTSNGISKLVDILFDYVNSVWLSKLGNGSFGWQCIRAVKRSSVFSSTL